MNDGARTHDNRNHNPGLYRLSYAHHSVLEVLKKKMVRLAGLEPATLGLEGRCSIQLSYKRIVVGVERFELPTSCSQSRRATKLRYTPIRPFQIFDLFSSQFLSSLKELTIIMAIVIYVKYFLNERLYFISIFMPR